MSRRSLGIRRDIPLDFIPFCNIHPVHGQNINSLKPNVVMMPSLSSQCHHWRQNWHYHNYGFSIKLQNTPGTDRIFIYYTETGGVSIRCFCRTYLLNIRYTSSYYHNQTYRPQRLNHFSVEMLDPLRSRIYKEGISLYAYPELPILNCCMPFCSVAVGRYIDRTLKYSRFEIMVYFMS